MNTIVAELIRIIKGAKDSIDSEEKIRHYFEELQCQAVGEAWERIDAELSRPEFATKKGREILDFIRLHALFSWQTREVMQALRKSEPRHEPCAACRMKDYCRPCPGRLFRACPLG